jgi:predicted XRE-type DNA-binding protein
MADFLDSIQFDNLSAQQKALIRRAAQQYVRDNKESAIGRKIEDPEFNQFMNRTEVRDYYNELLKGIVEARNEQQSLSQGAQQYAKHLASAAQFLKSEKDTQSTLTDLNRFNLGMVEKLKRLNDGLLRNDIKRQDLEKMMAELRQQRIRTEMTLVDVIHAAQTKAQIYQDQLLDRRHWKSRVAMTVADLDFLDHYEAHREKLKVQRQASTMTAQRRAISDQLQAEEQQYTALLAKLNDDRSNYAKSKAKSLKQDRDGSQAAIAALEKEQVLLSNTALKLQQKTDLIAELGGGAKGFMHLIEGLGKTRLGRFFDAKETAARMADASRVPGRFSSLGSMGPTMNAANEGLTSIVQGLAGKLLRWKAFFEIGEWIVESLAKADKRVSDLARSFAVSKQQARLLYDAIEGQHTALHGGGVNMDDLVGAQLHFNDAMGTSIVLNGTLNTTLAESVKLMGLSQEAAHGLAMGTILSGDLNKNLRDEVLGISKLEQVRHGLLLNDQQILEAPLKTTGTIRANFKGQVGDLTKAVTQAKMLGMNLEQVERIGESLLDWQGSIEKELNAELMIQKKLNLERARAYALQGDMNGLMGEIDQQVGGLDVFLRQNVMGQRTLAQAIGMSRSELSDVLFQKKAIAEINDKLAGNLADMDQNRMAMYGDALVTNAKFQQDYEAILKKTGIREDKRIQEMGELVSTNLRTLSAQHKFEESMSRIKEKIAQLFGDGQVLDKLADTLIRTIQWLPGDSGLLTSAERSKQTAIINRQTEMTSLANRKDLNSEVLDKLRDYEEKKDSMFADESGLYAAVKLALFKQFGQGYNHIHDGVIGPQGLVMSGAFGSIRTDPRDYLVATPNPIGLLGAGASDQQVGLLRQLMEVIRAGDQQVLSALETGLQVRLNGVKVNESLRLGQVRM